MNLKSLNISRPPSTHLEPRMVYLITYCFYQTYCVRNFFMLMSIYLNEIGDTWGEGVIMKNEWPSKVCNLVLIIVIVLVKRKGTLCTVNVWWSKRNILTVFGHIISGLYLGWVFRGPWVDRIFRVDHFSYKIPSQNYWLPVLEFLDNVGL